MAYLFNQPNDTLPVRRSSAPIDQQKHISKHAYVFFLLTFDVTLDKCYLTLARVRLFTASNL